MSKLQVESRDNMAPAVRYLLSALQISITTSTDSAIVLGCGSSNTLQSRLGNIRGSAGHCMWWVWQIRETVCHSLSSTILSFTLSTD